MGVSGLWDILRPAGKQRSLSQLAVHDGFERNPGGRRGLRVGIDASIWFYHATYGREGENPELRTLFFRCARLMSRPFLPLFVFDGPHRPGLKRKKKVSGKDHWMVSGMQEIIEAFGFEWWCAPGEAEAELAYLNKIGVIDAIITDDVDTFLFGATTIIRNPGKMLSGNSAHPVKNTAGKDDGEHTYTYNSSDISQHPDIDLTQGGMILIALLRGGDYDPNGVSDCGPTVAHALARCGFGDRLLEAALNLPSNRLQQFLDGWRTEVRAELRSNARGFLNSKKAKLAKSLPDTFPDIEVLQLYTLPVTSERKKKRPEFLWDREPDLMKLAALCERKFEWGVREIIVKRFRTVIWAPVVLRIMRRAVLDADAAGPSTPRRRPAWEEDGKPPGTPSKMITRNFSSLLEDNEDASQGLIVGIHGRREHASTDGMLEYRLEIAPAQLVRLTEAGVQGLRIPPSQYRDDSDEEGNSDTDEEDERDGVCKNKKGGLRRSPPAPDSHLRVWMPACIVERVEPAMVSAYESRAGRKAREKEDKATRKAARGGVPSPTAKSKGKGKEVASRLATKETNARRTPRLEQREEEEELSAEEDFSHVFDLPGKSKTKHAARQGRMRRNKPAIAIRKELGEELSLEEASNLPGRKKVTHATGRGKKETTRPAFTIREEEEEEEEEELSATEDFNHVFNLPGRSMTTHAPGRRRKGKTMTALDIREDEGEDGDGDKLQFARPMRNTKSNATPITEGLNRSSSDAVLRPTNAKRDQNNSQVTTSTGSIKQKTILDMLDERSSRLLASSTLSISSPRKGCSQSDHPFQTRPFPMSQESHGHDFAKTSRVSVRSRGVSALQNKDSERTSSRKYSSFTSDSDDSPCPAIPSLKKSPRKSPRNDRECGSPSSRQVFALREENRITSYEGQGAETDSDAAARPASPSPIRPMATSFLHNARKDELAIQVRGMLSSPDHMRSALSASKASRPLVQSNGSRLKSGMSEVIEITSSSESEQDRAQMQAKGIKKSSAEPSTSTSTKRAVVMTNRLDDRFQTVKSQLTSTQLKKARPTVKMSRGRPSIDMDDVIEIV